MPFVQNGTLTTDEREIAISEIWDTQTEWEANQSVDGIDITSGVLTLAESPLDFQGLLHQYDVMKQSTANPLVDQIGTNDLTETNFTASITQNGINSNPSIEIPFGGSFYLGNAHAVGTSGEFTLAFIAEWDSTGDFEYGLFNGDAGTHYGLTQENGMSQYAISSNGNVLGGPNTPNLAVYIITYDGANAEFYRNDTLLFQNGLTLYTIAGDLSWGGDHNDVTGEYLNFGELLIYDEYKTSTEATDIHDYLIDKWGTV